MAGAADAKAAGWRLQEDDAEEIAAKRRKLLGSSNGTVAPGKPQPHGQQSKKPKPPVKKNRLGQRARRILAGLGTGPSQSRQHPFPQARLLLTPCWWL